VIPDRDDPLSSPGRGQNHRRVAAVVISAGWSFREAGAPPAPGPLERAPPGEGGAGQQEGKREGREPPPDPSAASDLP